MNSNLKNAYFQSPMFFLYNKHLIIENWISNKPVLVTYSFVMIACFLEMKDRLSAMYKHPMPTDVACYNDGHYSYSSSDELKCIKSAVIVSSLPSMHSWRYWILENVITLWDWYMTQVPCNLIHCQPVIWIPCVNVEYRTAECCYCVCNYAGEICQHSMCHAVSLLSIVCYYWQLLQKWCLF